MSLCCLLTLARLIIACQPGFQTHRVAFSPRGPLLVSAEFPFSEVECVRIDVSDIRRHQDNLARTVWKARCPDRSDCLTSVQYGDPGLRTEVESEPLKATGASSSCYSCFVRGSAGDGWVSFSVSDEGEFDHCNLHLP